LVHPDVAWRAAEDEAAPPGRIQVVGRGVHVEPDLAHVREVAAELANQPVAGSARAPPRALHHARSLEARLRFQYHLQVGVEAARPDEHGPAADLDGAPVRGADRADA